MINSLRNIRGLFIETMMAFVDRVREWSQEPLCWIYLFTSLCALAAFSDGHVLFATLILMLGFSIEKRK